MASPGDAAKPLAGKLLWRGARRAVERTDVRRSIAGGSTKTLVSQRRTTSVGLRFKLLKRALAGVAKGADEAQISVEKEDLMDFEFIRSEVEKKFEFERGALIYSVVFPEKNKDGSDGHGLISGLIIDEETCDTSLINDDVKWARAFREWDSSAKARRNGKVVAMASELEKRMASTSHDKIFEAINGVWEFAHQASNLGNVPDDALLKSLMDHISKRAVETSPQVSLISPPCAVRILTHTGGATGRLCSNAGAMEDQRVQFARGPDANATGCARAPQCPHEPSVHESAQSLCRQRRFFEFGKVAESRTRPRALRHRSHDDRHVRC